MKTQVALCAYLIFCQATATFVIVQARSYRAAQRQINGGK